MDFSWPQRVTEIAARVKTFVDDEVIPLEPHAHAAGGLPPETLAELRATARAAGVYGPQLPQEFGGLGLNVLEICPVFEAAGRSLLGPLALNCAAPDEGNMHLLQLAATPEQRERYLRPLAAGELRSAFAMTEPAPGAGSDPAMLRTRARRDGDEWVIDGHKWFVSGADGAAFFIVMAVTDADAPATRGASMLIVPAQTPGARVVRRIDALGAHAPGGHCEIVFEGCRVPAGSVLGEVGRGFALAQQRLGPARLTHCMRWIGVAQRALEIAAQRALKREAFGAALAERQAIQWMLADSEIELHAGRMMVYQAAWLLQQGEQARQETAMCKVFVAEAINRVIDRAVQVCGSLGVSHDLPLADFYAEARAFRIYDGASEVHRMTIARQVLREAGQG